MTTEHTEPEPEVRPAIGIPRRRFLSGVGAGLGIGGAAALGFAATRGADPAAPAANGAGAPIPATLLAALSDPPDKTTALATNLTVSDQRASAYVLEGSFVADSTSAILEVESALSGSGCCHVGLILFVGPGVSFPLLDNSDKPKTGVSTYNIGKVSGGGLGFGGVVSERVLVTGLTVTQTVNWAIYPAIVGYQDLAPLAHSPLGIAIVPDNTKLYVSTSPTVTPVITGRTLDNYLDVPLPGINMATATGNLVVDLAATPDGSRVYAANWYGYALQGIDTTKDQIVLTAVKTNYAPFSVSISPDGTKAYTSDLGNSTIQVVNIPAGTFGTATAVPATCSPYFCRVSPDGTMLAVVCGKTSSNFQCIVYNTSTWAKIGQLDMGNASGDTVPPAWELDSAHFWLGNYGAGTIKRITASTVTVDGTAGVITMPQVQGIVLNPSTTKSLYAAGSSTTAGQDNFAVFSLPTGTRVDGLHDTPRKAIASTSDTFIYTSQSVNNQLQDTYGGTFFCRADPNPAIQGAGFWLEYCYVNLYGGH